MRVALFAPKQRLPLHHLPPAFSVSTCRNLDAFRDEFGRSELAVLDFRQAPPMDAATLTEQLLMSHPFVKVLAVVSAVGLSAETAFRLGQLGLWKMISAQEADDPLVWKRLGHELQAVSLMDRFRWQVEPVLRRLGAPLLMLFLGHLQAPAVKQLVHRAPINRAPSIAGRRRALGRRCDEDGLGAPEDVLFGLRLMFIKAAIDDGQWTHEQLAAHLEYSSAKSMWRSVKRRSGHTLRSVRTQPAQAFHADTVARFVQQKPGGV